MQTFMYPTGFQAQVYLKHDANNLYVCLIGMLGGNAQRFAGVYSTPTTARRCGLRRTTWRCRQ